MDKILKISYNLPPLFNALTNKNWKALISAIGGSDNTITTQIANTLAQLFVQTASGTYLDTLASGYGVSNPTQLSLDDASFSQLIPVMSLYPKQVTATMVALMDVVWGPTYTRANIQSNNPEPFNVSPGDTITLLVDNNAAVSYTVQTGQIATSGAATAQELVNIINNISTVTASVQENLINDENYVNIRTNTAGTDGSIQAENSGMVSPTKLDLPTNKVQIQELPLHAAIFQIYNRQLNFEIPALVPLLKRTLLGSHHWHQTYSMEPPEPSDNDIWVGSFLYHRDGTEGGFTVTSKLATLAQNIQKGQVYANLIATGATNIPNQTGNLIIDFGLNTQEGPIPYFGIPGANLVFISPDFIFQYNHSPGSIINYLSNVSYYQPRTNGQDYAVYLTSPVAARDTAEGLIEDLVASGVVCVFDVVLPIYTYPFPVNPYAG